MSNDLDLGFNQVDTMPERDTSMVQTSDARATAEVQAAYVIAKKFPRNQHEAYQNILAACKRPYLAEQAIYEYPRGGIRVSGPSIRLAEAVAQAWGNIDCGVKEISQSNGVSVAEAYAIDLQSNTRIVKTFHVKHERHTKKGKQRLTDPRDIYEMVANQGARRLRACVLGVIPGDVIDAAVEQCKHTLVNNETPIEEQVRNMIKAFEPFGVKVEHIEKYFGHNLDAITAHQIVKLKSIYRSLRDGMASRDQFFDIQSKKTEDAKAELTELVNKNKADESKNGQAKEELGND